MAAQTAKKNNFGASTIQIMGDDLGYAQEEEVYEDEEVVRASPERRRGPRGGPAWWRCRVPPRRPPRPPYPPPT